MIFKGLAMKQIAQSFWKGKTSKHFWLRKDCLTSFPCNFLCLQITAEISKIKKPTPRYL